MREKYSFQVTEKLKRVNQDSILPPEIFHVIFLYLKCKDLVEVFSSCGMFHSICHTTYFWRCYFQNSYKNKYRAFSGRRNRREENWKQRFFNEWCRRTNGDEGYKKKFVEIGMNETNEYDEKTSVIAKVILLGDSFVGKRSLLRRYFENSFEEGYAPLHSFHTKSLWSLKMKRCIKMEIWRQKGQERYRSLAPMYYRGASGCLVCFSIDSYDSFVRAKRWTKELERYGPKHIIVVLVGNKCDLEDSRKVESEEAMKYACEENLGGYVETSCRSNVNVRAAFGILAEKMLKVKKFEEKQTSNLNEDEEEGIFHLKMDDETESKCSIM